VNAKAFYQKSASREDWKIAEMSQSTTNQCPRIGFIRWRSEAIQLCYHA